MERLWTTDSEMIFSTAGFTLRTMTDEAVGDRAGAATVSARATAGLRMGSLLTVFCKKPKLSAKKIAPAKKLAPAIKPIFFM